MNLEYIEGVTSRCAEICTDKERDFLFSVKDFFIKKNFITGGQEKWLTSISEKYSEERLLEAKEWENNWSEEHRDTAIKVAHYYEKTNYFTPLVHKILSDTEGFVLSKREWDKFCENKYAKKIRKEYDSERKFSVGDSVCFRTTNKVRQANYFAVGRIHNKTAVVLKVDAKPITRAAKGARIYQVLVVGDTKPIYAHESDLKKARIKKR